jgi:hypothetical protein
MPTHLSIILSLLFCLMLCVTAFAQTTTFTYQGRLTDGAVPANGTYEMQFSLFNGLTGPAQIGSTITDTNVSVTNGIFTKQLTFAATNAFDGNARWLEIAVRKPGDPSYIILAPRQQITSSPYSIRTLSSAASDSLSATCIGCVQDAQINSVSGSKVSGAVASATLAGSATTAGNVTGVVGIANGGTNASNITTARSNLGLGSLATLAPTGTANNTTFLRGDNTWTAPAGSSNMFFNQFSNPGGGATTTFVALSGGASFASNVVANVMAVPCTVDGLRVAATITASAASDTLTFTLLKNGAAMSVTTGAFTVSTLNTTVFASDTAHSFTVAAGDTVSIQLAQTNGGPVVRLATTVHMVCQ